MDEAIPLYEQALADRQRVLGADHSDTLISRNNLAAACESATQDLAEITDCMAFGNQISAAGTNLPYAVKWHKGNWTVLPVPPTGPPNPELEGDSCPSASLSVAAGEAAPARMPGAFTEIYTAGKWQLAAKGTGGTALFEASCPATNECLVAGWARRSGLVWGWNGSSRTNLPVLQTTDTRPYDSFAHISCASTTKCEAVGARYNGNLADHAGRGLERQHVGHTDDTQPVRLARHARWCGGRAQPAAPRRGSWLFAKRFIKNLPPLTRLRKVPLIEPVHSARLVMKCRARSG